MNRLPNERRAALLKMLVEGNSPQATSHLADVSINTVTKLIFDLGSACSTYHDGHVQNVRLRSVQLNEVRTFSSMKNRQVRAKRRGVFGYGDVWTWVAIDEDTKLVPSFVVGTRGSQTARAFMGDLVSRTANSLQLKIAGRRMYLQAAERASRNEIDYATLVALYGNDADAEMDTGCREACAASSPDPCDVYSSRIGSRSLALLMNGSRLARLPNAFSRKVVRHVALVAIRTMYHNFARVQIHLGVTPAMAACLSDHIWSPDEFLFLAR
jgi:hypothetical protein